MLVGWSGRRAEDQVRREYQAPGLGVGAVHRVGKQVDGRVPYAGGLQVHGGQMPAGREDGVVVPHDGKSLGDGDTVLSGGVEGARGHDVVAAEYGGWDSAALENGVEPLLGLEDSTLRVSLLYNHERFGGRGCASGHEHFAPDRFLAVIGMAVAAAEEEYVAMPQVHQV